jgi:hypothetical protein
MINYWIMRILVVIFLFHLWTNCIGQVQKVCTEYENGSLD